MKETSIPMTYIDHLPGPSADLWDWQLHGSYRGQDSVIFFYPEDEHGRARNLREARARVIYRPCPVLMQCRNHALKVGKLYGVWGGLSESERNEILRAKPAVREHEPEYVLVTAM